MNEESQGKEKRRSHRISIKLPACFEFYKDTKTSLSIGSTLDISATGLCISSKEMLQVGTKLPLQVTLPDETKLIVNVGVMWVQASLAYGGVREYKIGVKIDEAMKADEAKFVKFYVSELQKARLDQPS